MAHAVFLERLSALGAGGPWTIGCQPAGPRAITHTRRLKIIQSTGLIIFLFQDLAYRQIFMDGRQLPDDLFPNFMGYSVGRWDGDRSEDVLLVDFNGRGRLPLIPLSNTTFSPRILGTFQFVTDGQYMATELLAHAGREPVANDFG